MEVFMAREVMETIYGKHEKFQIIKETSTFGSPKYFAVSQKKNYGPYSSLSEAVEKAKNS
jgi:hypothetical protein